MSNANPFQPFPSQALDRDRIEALRAVFSDPNLYAKILAWKPKWGKRQHRKIKSLRAFLMFSKPSAFGYTGRQRQEAINMVYMRVLRDKTLLPLLMGINESVDKDIERAFKGEFS